MKLSECKGQSFLINGKIIGYQGVLKMIYEGKLLGPISLVNIDTKYESDLSGVMNQMGVDGKKDKSLNLLQKENIDIDISKDDLTPINAAMTIFAIKDATTILLSECMEDEFMFLCDGKSVDFSDILGMIYNAEKIEDVSPIQAIQADTIYAHDNVIAMQKLWNNGEADDNKELSLLKKKNIIIDIQKEQIEQIQGYDDLYTLKQTKPALQDSILQQTSSTTDAEHILASQAYSQGSTQGHTPVESAPSAYEHTVAQQPASTTGYQGYSTGESTMSQEYTPFRQSDPMQIHPANDISPTAEEKAISQKENQDCPEEYPENYQSISVERKRPFSGNESLKEEKKQSENYSGEKPIPKNRRRNNSTKKFFRRFLSSITGWIVNIVLAIAVFYVLTQHIFINAEIPSESMEPTVSVGDKIIGLRVAYTFNRAERGDIAIFQSPDNPDELYIKRIIGLPGETVTIKKGKIYIDDAKEPLNEPYLAEEWTVKNDGLTYEVPDGHYFMLGDNRNVSYDARYWDNTFVPKDYLVAEAVFRYFPMNEIAILNEDMEDYFITVPIDTSESKE